MGAAIATVTAAVIAAVVTIISALLTRAHNERMLQATREHNEKTLHELRASERRKQLKAGLQEFLIPLSSQLMTMKALFKIFTANKPEEFRTLTYLLDPEHYEISGTPTQILLSDSDKKLMEDIVGIGRKVEQLLVEKGGLIDDLSLQGPYVPDPKDTDINPNALQGLSLFSVLMAHLRVLRLAFEGAIKGERDRYKDFVYPRELNKRVDAAIIRLRGELDGLSKSQPISCVH